MKITQSHSSSNLVFGDLIVGSLFSLKKDVDKNLYFKTYTTRETETHSRRNCVNLSNGLIEFTTPNTPVIKYSNDSELILKEEK